MMLYEKIKEELQELPTDNRIIVEDVSKYSINIDYQGVETGDDFDLIIDCIEKYSLGETRIHSVDLFVQGNQMTFNIFIITNLFDNREVSNK